MDYSEGEPCDQCGSTTYTFVNGVKFCENGHDQGEGQIVGEDEDDFGTQGRVVRRKVEKVRERASKVYRGPRAYRLFVQAYQFILWKQCFTLIHEKTLPPDLWTIVRDLWTLRLSRLLHRLGSPPPVDSESQAVSSAEETGDDGTRKPHRRDCRGVDSPKLIETVALCYLGMLLLRLPVGLADFFRWIREEDVLYVRAIQGVPTEMREKLPGEYHKVLDTTVMLQAEDLHNAVSDLATVYHHTFGLVLPPLNHEVLLYKYITLLALPLEIFPSVRGLAELTRSDFRYATTREPRRKQGSAFPELQLMSLVVVAVKLLYPFDEIERHPRSIREPATQKIDWKSWERHRQESIEYLQRVNSLRGREIEVRDTDVFNMSQQELDSYMDWYQKTWVREPRPGLDESVGKEIIDMFPLHSLDQSADKSQAQREQELEKLVTRRAKSTAASLKFQRPMQDEEVSDEQPDIQRPGKGYIPYKSEDDLPESAKAFFDSAAETACTSVKNLMLAVLHTEARITTWKRAKRRAEVTGQDLDLDAEMRAGPHSRLDTEVEEMEAMNMGGEAVRGEESGGEDSDLEMQLVA